VSEFSDKDLRVFRAYALSIACKGDRGKWLTEDMKEELVDRCLLYVCEQNRQGTPRLDTYRPEMASRSTWLYVMARSAVQNSIRDMLRGMTARNKIRTDLKRYHYVQTYTDQDEHVVLVVRDIMKTLTPDKSQILQMRAEGMSFPELGRAFGISAQAAHRRFSKAAAEARAIAGLMGVSE
jgi:RNA polymerase sigma factor (sigma-70 family)